MPATSDRVGDNKYTELHIVGIEEDDETEGAREKLERPSPMGGTV